MSPALCTAYGNGPFVPTVVYNGHAYPVGESLADMGEAIQQAIAVLQGIRDGMRSPGFDETLAALD